MKPKQEDPKEMVGGCCVCSDENGWTENPLVYCDGQGCNVAVHQACYGIVTVPTGAWFCRKCESQERAARVDFSFQRCELCPSKDGALKRTDSGGWAHVVCALYIPEVRFGNVTTMEPIMLQLIPQERFNKSCYLCDEAQRGSKATIGACMQCNRAGCKNHFHVTCAQAMGLLCEEAGNYLDNVKYCGYCQYHYNKLRRGSHVKTIPPYRPVPHDIGSSDDDKTSGASDSKEKLKRRAGKISPVNDTNKQLTREVKVHLGDLSGPSKAGGMIAIGGGDSSSQEDLNMNLDFSLNLVQSSLLNVKAEPKLGEKLLASTSSMLMANTTTTITTPASLASSKHFSNPFNSGSDSKILSGTFLSSSGLSHNTTTVTSPSASSSSSTAGPSVTSSSESATGNVGTLTVAPSTSASVPSPICTSSASITSDNLTTVVSTVISLPSKLKMANTVSSVTSSHPVAASHAPQPSLSVSLPNSNPEKDRQRKTRRNGSGSRSSAVTEDVGMDDSSSKEGALIICEERNLSADKSFGKMHSSPDDKFNVHFTTNVSVQAHKLDAFPTGNADSQGGEPMKRARSSSQDRGRRSKRGISGGGGGTASKRGRMATTSRDKESNRDSGASSPESLAPDSVQTKRGGRGAKPAAEAKETKESPSTSTSVITNGVVGANALLLGNQINPASAVAQKMADTLNAELEAHSIYKEEEKVSINLIGPALPGKKDSAVPGPSSSLSSSQPPPLPQSLEQLLERQWEQGSQFLMEQAQHFDIASLLSCLHQLRQENVRLEESVNTLIARRDHLLAVNARLSVPLGSSQNTTQASTSTTSSLPSSLTGVPSTSHSSTICSTASLVSITPTAPPPISTALIGGQLQISHSGGLTSTSVLPPARVAHPPQQRHPSGGSSHVSHGIPPSSVSGGRGTSPHDRRNPHQGPPLENGLTEPEYRYRSPGTDHHQRQQSPMLPPGAQPSPTSMRQSPASSTYHSVSPHTGVPSLSPSGVHPPPPPQHTIVAHVPPHGSHVGHPPVLASSSHGPHTVALSRPSEHTRAELVRLAATQSHSTPGVGYPVYQMVSPPVPGPHHSPVMQQHPSHSQVLRREVVEPNRGSHSLEKR